MVDCSYIVGTVDGLIHRCSRSYDEQYLTTFTGHTGPVYRVCWSPFVHSLFLSCSSDWSVRIWNQEKEECLLKLSGGRDAITDIQWSPVTSTVFGCVTLGGRIEIWDLRTSV